MASETLLQAGFRNKDGEFFPFYMAGASVSLLLLLSIVEVCIRDHCRQKPFCLRTDK